MNTLYNHLVQHQLKQAQYLQRVKEVSAPQQRPQRRVKGLGGDIIFEKR
ncbi:hypothetical protein pEaSNUABM29_00087 [Erwinia phage pEa_SNUABM_29]|nr:hypothetical protein pEaSNUABM29_00087 [Erwinia phage pEa_SNUABM_29]